MGPSQAQPPASRVDAMRLVRSRWRLLDEGLTTLDPTMKARAPGLTPAYEGAGSRAHARPRLRILCVREAEQGVEEDVGAALDGARVARLVDAVAASALRRDEDHAGLGHGGEVLRVVAGRGVHALRREAQLRTHGLGRGLDVRRAVRGYRRRHRPDLHAELPLRGDALGDLAASRREAFEHRGIGI